MHTQYPDVLKAQDGTRLTRHLKGWGLTDTASHMKHQDWCKFFTDASMLIVDCNELHRIKVCYCK